MASFGAALRRAIANRTDIEDLPHAKIPPLADQAGLAAKLRGWVASDEATKDGDVHAVNEHSIAQHLPLLDPADVETLRAVAESGNFLIREAAAHFLAASPRPAHVPIANRLAVDGHRQVAIPARRALVALGAPQPPLTPEEEDSIPLPDRDAVGMVFSLVERPSGTFRLTMDFVRREDNAPSFTWRTSRDYSFQTFSAEQIEEYEGLHQTKIPVEELARISRVILGQLFWQRKEGRKG